MDSQAKLEKPCPTQAHRHYQHFVRAILEVYVEGKCVRNILLIRTTGREAPPGTQFPPEVDIPNKWYPGSPFLQGGSRVVMSALTLYGIRMPFLTITEFLSKMLSHMAVSSCSLKLFGEWNRIRWSTP